MVRLALILGFIGWPLAAALANPPVKKVDYARQIRPLLADKCLACHGADAHQRQAGLRLDQPADALKGGESEAPAIVPGQPDASELVKRIESADESIQMPPPASKKSLTPEEKALFRRWIAEGGEYQKHWAFETPVRPTVPQPANRAWPQTDIDRFVLSRLDEEQLAPAAEAEKTALLRRLSLDLTGLPPTTAELDEFLADKRTDAYARHVERLLSSPHYGERWGRLWLDGARYADSDGYEKDKPRFVWAYRDWVVGALNRDLPYNQFVIEQIAGDLLPDPTQDQLVATGFLRNSMLNEEGGIDPEQFRMEAMFDRMDAIGKSVLGLTIQCCQCHDHKYDPISQLDYYRLFAFFNDAYDAVRPVYTPAQQMERRRILDRIAEIESALQHQAPDWQERLAAWMEARQAAATSWTHASPRQEVSGGEKHYVLKDGSILAQGYAPTKSTAEFVVTVPLTSVRSVRLELLNHPDLPLSGPGRATDGTCALTEIQIEAGPADDSTPLKPVKIASATADVNPPEEPLAPQFKDKTDRKRMTGPIAFAFDGKKETAWGINTGPGRSNVPRNAVFVLDKPLEYPAGTKLRFKLVQEHGGWNSDDNQTNNLGRFRFSVSDKADALADPFPPTLQNAIDKPAAERTPAEQNALFRFWRTQAPECAAGNQEIESLWRRHPLPASQLAMQDRDDPRETFTLMKGNFLAPKEKVSKGVPAILPPLHVENPTRLDLARWLVDEKSPTAARSIVNRVWQTYFGQGLVTTSEDFGLQGAPPSHPELLDWLAVEFMQQGWSLKHLHRLIVTSAVYQQSSNVSPELLARDPDNALLARGARFRMEAEGVRDICLAASGLINLELGGPPVCPPCPEFLFQPPASYGPKTWSLATGPERYRRALYTFRFRSVPYPALQVFDAPIGEVSCVRRVKSNTPLQALATLNEPVFLECARGLAAVALQDPNCSDSDRIGLTFRRCTSRRPDQSESAALLAFLKHQRERLAKGDLPATIALNEGEQPPAEDAWPPLSKRAAWTSVCRVMLNLDETITRP